MFLEDIEDAFHTLLNEHFSVNIIKDYENKPEPKGDYGVFGITLFNKLHRDENEYYKTPSSMFESVKQEFQVSMTFRFYGKSCYSLAFEAQALLQALHVQERLFYDHCISNPSITNIRRIPEKRDTIYKDKASFDLECFIGFEHDFEIDWFDTVVYEGVYKEQGGRTVLEDNQTVEAGEKE